jgi:AcrR family transcriptional regulator
MPLDTSRKSSRALDTQVAVRLLEAGRRAFSQNGLYATRIEEITQLAGVAKGTFYLYFNSKEDLIHAIADEAVLELGLICRRAETIASWPDRLAAVTLAHLDFFREHPDWMRILHQLRGMLKFERPEWQALRDTLERHVGELAAVLGVPPAPRQLDEKGAVSLARVLFGAISGAVSVWVSCEGPGGEHPPPKALVPALVAFANAYIGELTVA